MVVFIHDALFIVIKVILGNDIFQVVHRVMIGTRTRRNFVFLVSSGHIFDNLYFVHLCVFCIPLSLQSVVTCDGFKTMGEDTWTF